MSPFRTPRENIRRELDKRRSSEADINYRHYVRPHGSRGIHVVKASVDGREYFVSGPGRTFQPGTVVPTGSNTGNQGEFIVTDPPPGRRGAGNFPPSTIVKRSCPRCIKGREYIGITDSGATDILKAWKYLDGTPLELLDTASLPAELQTGGDTRVKWELITPTKIAFVAQDIGNDDRVVIWNLGGSVGAQSHGGSQVKSRLIWTLGSIWYLIEVNGFDETKAYRVAPFIGEDHDFLGDINVTFPSLVSIDNLAIVGGQPYIWSDDLDPFPSGTAYVGIGTDNFGPAIPDLNSNQRGGGYMLNSGETLFSRGVAGIVNSELTERSLWPAGWHTMGFFGVMKLPLSTQSEYGLFHFNEQTATRLALKDYSGLNATTCPIPTFEVLRAGGLVVEALLPL